MRPPSSLAVGIADRLDPSDIEGGSGASASLLAAIDELVGRTVSLSGQLPPALARATQLASVVTRLRPHDVTDLRGAARRTHAAALLARPTSHARSWLMRRQLSRAGRLDAVVQRGSDMQLPRSCAVVTLEDSTVLQAWHGYPWAHLQGLTERDVQRYAERQRKVYEAAVACCCATHWVADSIVGSYGIPRERVFTVGMGMNHELREPPARDWSQPRYLFVGVDWQRKNGAGVLAAFARVRDSHPTAQLDVVGGHPQIEQAGVVTHGLLSLGNPADRERMAQLYREATVFVMPSLHEPAGLVYVEAGGAGVASIGTTDGGAATMIGPGGVVVDPADPAQLVDAMLDLADPDTARRLGALAYEHSKLFTWRKVAERVIRAMGVPDLDATGLAALL
jgi:glycosyltransferase involved in cell wall biosynthesis